MASRLRRIHPPTKPVPHSGQFSTERSARWVGVIRWRAKPRPHGFLAPLYYEGRSLEADLLHGIPHRPPLFRRPSKASIRRCNSSMICCNRAITANSVSRLAVLRSTVVDSNRSLARSSDMFAIQP